MSDRRAEQIDGKGMGTTQSLSSSFALIYAAQQVGETETEGETASLTTTSRQTQ